MENEEWRMENGGIAFLNMGNRKPIQFSCISWTVGRLLITTYPTRPNTVISINSPSAISENNSDNASLFLSIHQLEFHRKDSIKKRLYPFVTFLGVGTLTHKIY